MRGPTDPAIGFWRTARRIERRRGRPVEPWLGECIPPERDYRPIKVIERRAFPWPLAAAAVAVALSAVIWLAGQARGHSWYPVECCSGRDCDEIAASRVKVLPSGYLIDGKHAVSYSQTRPSPDAAYHACFPQPDRLRCFFAPHGST